MALVLFGIYVLIVDKVRISPRCGLRGQGARIAGAFYLVLGVCFITIFDLAILNLARALELRYSAAVAMSGVLQIATFFLVPVVLMRFYGNAFKKHHHRRRA